MEQNATFLKLYLPHNACSVSYGVWISASSNTKRDCVIHTEPAIQVEVYTNVRTTALYTSLSLKCNDHCSGIAKYSLAPSSKTTTVIVAPALPL